MAHKYCFIFMLIISVICTLINELEAGERNYNIQPQKMEKMSVDPKWGEIKMAKVTKLNSTYAVIVGSIEFKEDLPEDMICTILGKQDYGGGNYGSAPTKFGPSDCCESIAKDTLIWPFLMEVSNLPAKCPFKKGTYNVTNFDVNNSNLPDVLPPPNDWKLELTVEEKTGGVILEGHAFAKILRDGKKG